MVGTQLQLKPIIHFLKLSTRALYHLTHIPAYELTNNGIDAESVFSKEIRLINSWLNSTDNYREMIHIVETFLTEKFKELKSEAHGIDQISKLLLTYSYAACIQRRWLTPRHPPLLKRKSGNWRKRKLRLLSSTTR
ncbi:hypothetical protein HNV11_08475 [Spirosoma taeanense]|uniref:Uncharacterized protein n=1 Tax=Spirosoma taeanense TaxID=2735870 RepID=A0A6M5Y7M0_9BACT|nr:hypothetical protein [Spirosoma taeanense]QJW89416.1 hypothetical protein HNV11_08475 [Spirosoma taeanense]